MGPRAPHLLRGWRLGDPLGSSWPRSVAQWGQVPLVGGVLMIFAAQQANASVISNHAAMSSAGICRTVNATTCTGVVSSMAQPTVAMLPRNASPIKIAPRMWPRTKRLVLTPGSPLGTRTEAAILARDRGLTRPDQRSTERTADS